MVCFLPACITRQTWPNSVVMVMEEEKRWEKQKGMRNRAQGRSNKSQACGKEGCEKEGLGIEVISGQLSSGPICVCVHGLNSFTVWGQTGVGGLDLETDWNFKSWFFQEIQRNLSLWSKLPLPYRFHLFLPNPFLACVPCPGVLHSFARNIG